MMRMLFLSVFYCSFGLAVHSSLVLLCIFVVVVVIFVVNPGFNLLLFIVCIHKNSSLSQGRPPRSIPN